MCDEERARGRRAWSASVVAWLIAKAAEAASWLPNEVKELYSGVAWERLKGMTNRLLHGYQATDLSIVWGVCSRDASAALEALAVDC